MVKLKWGMEYKGEFAVLAPQGRRLLCARAPSLRRVRFL